MPAKPKAIDSLRAEAHHVADSRNGHALYKRWSPLLVSQDRARWTTACRRCGASVTVDTRPPTPAERLYGPAALGICSHAVTE